MDIAEIFRCYFEVVTVRDRRFYMQKRNTLHRLSSGFDDGRSDRFIASEVFDLDADRLTDLVTQLTPDDIALDIGAHKGYFSVYISQYVGRVVAFEPDALNAYVLERNLELNHVSNVKVHQVAVCSADGTRTFYRSGTSPASHSLVPSRFMGKVKEKQVECVSLEGIFKRYGIHMCALVKMDCEGSEYEILFETPRSVISRVRTFLIELHQTESLKHTFEQAVSFLSTHGFLTDVYGFRQPTDDFGVCMVKATRCE